MLLPQPTARRGSAVAYPSNAPRPIWASIPCQTTLYIAVSRAAWDHVPEGSKIPHGESSQWGDYHLREAAVYVQRVARGEQYLAFFGPANGAGA